MKFKVSSFKELGYPHVTDKGKESAGIFWWLAVFLAGMIVCELIF